MVAEPADALAGGAHRQQRFNEGKSTSLAGDGVAMRVTRSSAFRRFSRSGEQDGVSSVRLS